MDNREVYKIFDKAMSMLQEQSRVKMSKTYFGHPKSAKISSQIMKEMTARAVIEKLLGYERTDDGKRIIKRKRTPQQNKENELALKAASGDLDAAEELLNSFTERK